MGRSFQKRQKLARIAKVLAPAQGRGQTSAQLASHTILPVIKIFNAALGSAAALALTISAGSAQALVTVNISGTDYILDTFNGSTDDNIEKFNLTQMPWLGSFDLASEFALAADVAGIGIKYSR